MKKMFVMAMLWMALACSANGQARTTDTMSLVFRDVPVAELFEMLSRKERVNIVLSRGVSGRVTVNLYDMSLHEAIHTVAEAAGYGVERVGTGYLIVEQKKLSVPKPAAGLVVKALAVQYSNPKMVAEILARHCSPDGRVTLLEERRMLVIEDTKDRLPYLERILRELDRQPAQILIEAKILEISLDDTQQFGVDWNFVFGAENRGRLGTQGLGGRGSQGLLFSLANRNIELYLNALSDAGRVQTLATPRLLTLEHREAVTNIGDQIGYKVSTTTGNSLTQESVQFLDTGVILRVTPALDGEGRIAMTVRPEVSAGRLFAGVPSKTTTEVITQLVAEDGQSILIGGLIKKRDSALRTGIPVLGDLPGIGALFSTSTNTTGLVETVVIITPRIVRHPTDTLQGISNGAIGQLGLHGPAQGSGQDAVAPAPHLPVRQPHAGASTPAN